MRIEPITFTKQLDSVSGVSPKTSVAEVTENNNTVSFKDTIKNAIKDVNSLQDQADQLTVNLSSGNVEDVHKAMIAMQKAKLALDLTIQVRNKVIDAYQEIMRMQV